jgi:two-component system, OmpR family, alkaline phosphatase synthesis response regulator PhoP
MVAKGAVMVATSPRAPKGLSKRRDSKKKRESGRGGASIAIVENEKNLISIYSYVVKELGFRPIFIARGGEEILKAVADGRASPDVIIMDYRLPGINGIETAKRIVERRPSTKVIVASADDSIRDESISLGFSFLQKPFSLETFAKRIKRIVSQLPDNPSSTVHARSLPRRKRFSHRT